MLARFCAAYPGLYRLPWRQTDDGVIPWQAFYLLYAEISTLANDRQLDAATAVEAGIGMAFGGGEVRAEVLRALRDDEEDGRT